MLSARATSPWARWFLLGLLTVSTFQVIAFTTSPVHAQDEAAAAEDEHPKETSTFMWIVKTSGLIGAFLLLLSIYFIALVVRLFLELREEATAPPVVVQQCQSLLEQRNVQGMYDALKGDEAYFSQVLATGIAELPHGLDEAREAAERQAEAQTVEMEKKISMLAVLGTLGPMIGLLGTLKGMIASFAAIAMSGTSLKAAEVAEGISEALLLTFEGVALSVPAIYFYAFFRNRVSGLSVQAQLLADDFLRKIARMMRKGAGSAARPAANV